MHPPHRWPVYPHAPAAMHACSCTQARLHAHARSAAHPHACMHRARTHVHTRRLLQPICWWVPADARCHRPGTGALLRGEDEEGPRLLRPCVPRVCPPVPHPIQPFRSRATSIATAELSPETNQHCPAPCPAAPQGRESRGGGTGDGCCPSLQASLPAPTAALPPPRGSGCLPVPAASLA